MRKCISQFILTQKLRFIHRLVWYTPNGIEEHFIASLTHICNHLKHKKIPLGIPPSLLPLFLKFLVKVTHKRAMSFPVIFQKKRESFIHFQYKAQMKTLSEGQQHCKNMFHTRRPYYNSINFNGIHEIFKQIITKKDTSTSILLNIFQHFQFQCYLQYLSFIHI